MAVCLPFYLAAAHTYIKCLVTTLSNSTTYSQLCQWSCLSPGIASLAQVISSTCVETVVAELCLAGSGVHQRASDTTDCYHLQPRI
jgi:hypothetical protein